MALDAVSGANGRSYITYAMKENGQVVYVGRASGAGTPAEVLAARMAKGHDYLLPGVSPEVIAIQRTKLANQGAEEFYIQGYRELGSPLRNQENALSFGSKTRTQSSLSKIEAFFDELFGR
jgi:hypothetical protein